MLNLLSLSRTTTASAAASPLSGAVGIHLSGARSMATLQQIALRLKSVKNIRKITKTMKMVSSAKFKRAEQALREAAPMGVASASVQTKSKITFDKPPSKLLVIAMSSDRGLCGGIHSGLCKSVRSVLGALPETTDVKIVAVGDKPRAILTRTHRKNMVLSFNEIGRQPPTFDEASFIAQKVLATGFDADRIDIFHNHYRTPVSFNVRHHSLPGLNALEGREELDVYDELDTETLRSYQEFTLASTIFAALLDAQAAEQSSRMSAMENATKNASEMIDKLTLKFNRSRQAVITNELTEIISGASAVE